MVSFQHWNIALITVFINMDDKIKLILSLNVIIFFLSLSFFYDCQLWMILVICRQCLEFWALQVFSRLTLKNVLKKSGKKWEMSGATVILLIGMISNLVEAFSWWTRSFVTCPWLPLRKRDWVMSWETGNPKVNWTFLMLPCNMVECDHSKRSVWYS